MNNNIEDSLQPINSKTMRDEVTVAIRHAILNGDFRFGEKVNQVHIAKKLGTSRAPIREALRQLEEEGLIVSIPHKGTFVVEITPDHVKDLYDLRRVIEIYAVRCLIDRAEPEDLERLRATVTEVQQAQAVADYDRSGQLALQFHSLIYHGAHHNVLLPMWKSIEGVVRLCITSQRRTDDSDIRYDTADSLSNILAAIERKDVDQASHLLDKHLRRAGENVYNFWVANLSDIDEG